jgi:hypothetical protein
VDTVDRDRLPLLEKSGSQHGLGAGDVLLGGLKHQHHRARHFGTQTRQRLGERDADGGVDVVTADVTDAKLERAELDRVWCVGGHGVHVGTIRHQRAGARATDQGDDTVASDTGAHLEAQLAQPRRHLARGPLLGAGELGVLVQVAPERDEPGLLRAQTALGPDQERIGIVSGCRQEGRKAHSNGDEHEVRYLTVFHAAKCQGPGFNLLQEMAGSLTAPGSSTGLRTRCQLR